MEIRAHKAGLRTLGLTTIALLLIAVGALVANAALADRYSAEAAVRDYFAAQQKRDVDAIMAGAIFLHDGSDSTLFDRAAIAAMMKLPANSDLRDVTVAEARVIGASSAAVDVSMTWNGKRVSRQYTVRRDAGNAHFLLYRSWRVEIPYEQVHLELPRQPGSVSVDGITLPMQPSGPPVQVVQGFHKVAMDSTALLDGTSKDVDTSSSGATVSLDSLLKPTVIAEATTAVKDAFARCDPAKFDDCVNHPYSAPSSSSTFYLTLPGYGRVGYSKYVFSLAADPTNDINLVLGAGPGQVTASGTCATTLTVDDSKTYSLKGDYTALLTWNGRTFGAEVTGACDRDKA